jgi:predicted DNA-binding transcriptional regulator AlpA
MQGENRMEETTKFLTDVQVSTITGLSIQTLRNWRFQGKGPAYSKCGARAIRYEERDVLEFMREKKVMPEN